MARYISTTKIKLGRTYKLYGTAGTYTFTTPNDVDSLDVAVWGGGGNGCCVQNTCTYGGSGGGFACGTIATSPGKQWTVTVGGSQGTSSFGTALSATGGVGYNAPGVGCVCSTANVTSSNTACGGLSYLTGSAMHTVVAGAGSGSPYGTGGLAGCGNPGAGGGAGGGGGWGPNASGANGTTCSSGGGGGGAGYPAFCAGGGGTAGSGTCGVWCGNFVVSTTPYSVYATYQCGGSGITGLGAVPAIFAPGTVCAGNPATDCTAMDPFLRIDRLTGGGGAGGILSSCFTCSYVAYPNTSGSNGGGGGGAGFSVPHNAGNGGIGGGGGGCSYCGSGGNGGFGGGAGVGGLPGCGGGGWAGAGSFGGQGAVLVVYDK